MATRIRDRFDEIPEDLDRVGAHRAPPRRGRGWIAVAWAALATVALVVAALFGLAQLNPNLDLGVPGTGTEAEGDAPEGDAAADPVLDPQLSVTVLNGTGTPGLANVAGDSLVEQGWDGAAEGVGSRANAEANDVEVTLVYYSDPANEGAARMLVEHLGVGEIRLSNAYPASPVVVLLGADYEAIAG